MDFGNLASLASSSLRGGVIQSNCINCTQKSLRFQVQAQNCLLLKGLHALHRHRRLPPEGDDGFIDQQRLYINACGCSCKHCHESATAAVHTQMKRKDFDFVGAKSDAAQPRKPHVFPSFVHDPMSLNYLATAAPRSEKSNHMGTIYNIRAGAREKPLNKKRTGSCPCGPSIIIIRSVRLWEIVQRRRWRSPKFTT